MNVRVLSTELQGKIRSGIAINTIYRCVDELVLNSLDASATCIAVRLDLHFYKIQVFDNGQGISYEDLQLVGERYATSKCYTLEDLYSSKTFGHRGEALASIRESSQAMTVTSRTRSQQKTYIKTMHGAEHSTITESSEARPSCGTTVNIVNFLHSLPVRQALIDTVQDVEGTRRILEFVALMHPHVSFTLYDDTCASWCLRIPKLSSKLLTFGCLYGNSWIPLLKPVSGRREHFTVDGFMSTKGYHNRNLQLWFVHGRRIVEDKLNKIINNIFDSVSKCSWASTVFPVFFFEIDCPRKMYDIGFDPSKTLVKFDNFDVLKELIVDLVKSFLEQNPDCCHSKQQVGDVFAKKCQAEERDHNKSMPFEFTVDDYSYSLHSLAAKRPHRTALEEKHCKSPQEQLDNKVVDDDEPPLKLDCMETDLFPSSPLTLYRDGTTESEVETRPLICLNPVVASRPLALRTQVSDEERKERTAKAILELQRYARKASGNVDGPKNHILQDNRSTKTVEKQRVKPNPNVALSRVRSVSTLPTVESLLNTFNRGRLDSVERTSRRTSPDLSSDKPVNSSPSANNCLNLADASVQQSPDLLMGSTVQQTLDSNSETSQQTVDQIETKSRRWIIGSSEDDCFYIDASNGNSYFGRPSDDHLVKDYDAPIVSGKSLPLDLFPDDEMRLSTISLPDRPWKNKDGGEAYDRSSSQLANMLKKWNNPMFAVDSPFEEVSAVVTVKQFSSPEAAGSSAATVQSFCFSRNIFHDIKCVAQVDRKFIVCLSKYGDSGPSPNLLLLFDQHAIHERIRLEQMLKDANYGSDSGSLTSTVLEDPVIVRFPSVSEVSRSILGHRHIFVKYGIQLIDVTDDGQYCALVIGSLPSCLVVRDISEQKQNRPSVLYELAKALILEISEDIRFNRKTASAEPKTVLNVIKSQACHGAIKFNQRLSKTVCDELVYRLGQCLLPFQCAHGRLSVIALVDLTQVPQPSKLSKPNLSRLKRLMDEHTTKH